MNKKTVFTFLSIILVSSNMALAGDIASGKGLSIKCMGCHGANGISTNPTAPHLAGKDIAYLADKLNAYRDGRLPNPLMKSMVSGLSDADVDNLASYYNSLVGE